MTDRSRAGGSGCGCWLLGLFFVGVPLLCGGGGIADVLVFPLRLALAFPAIAVWVLFVVITSGARDE